MFFRIGGVTLEVIENPDSKSLSYGGVGWHSENISKCHKRLIDPPDLLTYLHQVYFL